MSRPPISFESGDPRYHNLLLFAMFGSFWSFQIIVWGLALGPYIYIFPYRVLALRGSQGVAKAFETL